MKSAYELAMERLNKEDPNANKPLSDEQKTQLAEIDERYKAKKAERDIFLQQQLASAQAASNFEEVAQLERQRANELARLEEEKEAAKDQIRGAR
ncbi:hypothetical protein [Coraliomargarita akajimensis]|uniref:Uncharacterized protein n=1 Tax=Coraliomargarita akajimensis (strain DSM 45221 / IAM 15411 / JCM 23193 / KCTC 12865 / 04OKA010-24) TaxID=583355 RepID=D5ENJ0_CORAD|nr:hypothetical protein [Coraliomargarita akajimensis]ADE55466.1 conserved hypothetical protein [Coraliomargarita akajimensis DSM 45221]